MSRTAASKLNEANCENVAVGVDGEDRPHDGGEVDRALVGDMNGLGPAGRAGGVDHVRRLAGQDGHVRAGVVGPSGSLGVMTGRPAIDSGAMIRRGLAVGEHVGQPVSRVVRVQRQIDAARLPHAEDRGDHVHAPGQAETDDVFGPSPEAIRWWAIWLARASSSA